MRYLRILYIVVVISLLSSCKPDETIDVNQDKIFTEYELFYNKVEQRTYASAKFRHKKSKGTVLKLSAASSVAFADQKLSYNPSLQQYEKTFDSLISNGEFVWIDTDGRKYKNSIELSEISLPEKQTMIQDQNNSITWQGLPLREGEYVILFLNSPEGGAQYIADKSFDTKSVDVQSRTLEKLPKGELLVRIERNSVVELNEKTGSGGTLKGKYRSSEVSVTLK
jgi:hypothetical protein